MGSNRRLGRDVASQMYNSNTKSEDIFWLNLAVYNYLPTVNVLHVLNFSQDNDCGIVSTIGI